jgi:hypothetical protein
VTPREQLMVASWEADRMRAALLSGDVEARVEGPRLGRLLSVGVLLGGVVVAVLLLG